MHHKFMVVDNKTVLTGSYNYTTYASTLNNENLIVISSKDTAESFLKEWRKLEKETD